MDRIKLSRRDFQKLALTLPAQLALAALAGRSAGIALAQPASPTETPVLAPTPACGDDDDLAETPPQTEGPFFTPNSPERTSLLEPGMAGTRLVVSGSVVTTSCQPIAGALIDFWQCDDSGQYDNVGYRLRGHQFTDAQGRYRLEAVLPGLYPGRTRHIHVKVQPSGGRTLTTQLYFPGEARNASDGIYRKECEVAMSDAADGKDATFTFVLNA